MRESIAQQLTGYVSKLPEDKQRRFNEGLQKDLVEALADGAVRAQINELMSDQQKMEKKLHEERELFLRSWQGDANLEARLLENDSRILQLCDEMRQRQQAVLNGLRVPVFRVTDVTRDIELQMLILEFIVSLQD